MKLFKQGSETLFPKKKKKKNFSLGKFFNRTFLFLYLCVCVCGVFSIYLWSIIFSHHLKRKLREIKFNLLCIFPGFYVHLLSVFPTQIKLKNDKTGICGSGKKGLQKRETFQVSETWSQQIYKTIMMEIALEKLPGLFHFLRIKKPL